MFKGIYHGKKCHAADIPAVTGGSLKESREALEIAETDRRLFCTVGVHPTRCGVISIFGLVFAIGHLWFCYLILCHIIHAF
ncbi:hypothetical protein GQ55_9G312200 [Panicum hallii var. hallii]|uniref:Uncharacterized protein n=1 Tax=Panicum hallii var. hallii TaxID=1504633 RepID=A0A2T7C808_9POAL|nr:hypothetical protein GQ55_9G312200 [Panicum hallii var. hallii]